jgi:hypothetical protein
MTSILNYIQIVHIVALLYIKPKIAKSCFPDEGGLGGATGDGERGVGDAGAGAGAGTTA